MNSPDRVAEVMHRLNTFRSSGNLGSPARIRFYLDRLFEGVDLRDARVLDVGAGTGLTAFWAVAKGARSVQALEPEAAGGSTGMNSTFEQVRAELAANNVTLSTSSLEEFDAPAGSFDVIVMHNVINHFDEAACRDINAPSSVEKYRAVFKKCRELLAEGGTLVIADASRRNVFGDIGLRSPLAPSIEWDIHQPPGVWASIAAGCGFRRERLAWTTLGALGRLGARIGNNPLAAYLTLSHFVLVMRAA